MLSYYLRSTIFLNHLIELVIIEIIDQIVYDLDTDDFIKNVASLKARKINICNF